MKCVGVKEEREKHTHKVTDSREREQKILA